MKAYKGFSEDMTCRGYQYKEGRVYHEDVAELCESGFHACKNPIDCLKYYNPAHSVYHEVEVDELAEKTDNFDSKICGKTIKIGARLNALGICQAHFEYVKSLGRNNEISQDYSALTAQDNSSFTARNRSSLATQNNSALVAQHRCSLAAQDGGTLVAEDHSALAAQDYSVLVAEDYSTLAAQSASILSAEDNGTLAARHNSILTARSRCSLAAQDNSSLVAQDGDTLAAQNHSTLTAQDFSALATRDSNFLAARNNSSLAAQDFNTLSAGKNSVIAAFNSKARGDMGTLIALANREYIDKEWKITDFKAGIVDGENLKPNVWYELKNGEFVEVENEQTN
jgi:hypothetical protein